MDIHTRIKNLRIAKRLSMQTLAEKVGVTWQTVQHWERPEGSAPKRTRLKKVAIELDTTPEFLLYGAEITGKGAPWPFTRIDPNRYMQLTENQRAGIEDWIAQQIDLYLGKSQ